MNYLEFCFVVVPRNPATEILIAALGERGFESFLETETGVQAYIPEKEFSGLDLATLTILEIPDLQITYTSQPIEQQNWNAAWEENFHPITITDRCRIRAPFHTMAPIEYDIVISPKMSFGTGHHETTHMMLQLLLEEEISGQTVLDMGCGTGVLAILAEKKGASEILAVDIDPWSYENAKENVTLNQCSHIAVFQGDAGSMGTTKFDRILANINRNILLEDIPKYNAQLKTTGSLLLSGFYLKDLDAISAKCMQYDLKLEKKLLRNDWVAAKYVH
ncbi:MAG: 50S ribosomal protein L11 methyltransferase [Bacteroidota bacterium]